MKRFKKAAPTRFRRVRFPARRRYLQLTAYRNGAAADTTPEETLHSEGVVFEAAAGILQSGPAPDH